MSISQKCKIEGCESVYKLSKGLCNYHHGVKWYKDRPLYGIWQQMKSRCYRKTHPRYKDWGGRGITVCDRWLNSYEQFAKDMGEKPTPYHTIDRINNDLGYSPENCRWSTPQEQSDNKRALYKNNTSGHVNVSYNKNKEKWITRYSLNGKNKYLGFPSKELAIEHYHKIFPICKQCDK